MTELTITMARAHLSRAVRRGEIERPATCPCCARSPRPNAFRKPQIWARFPQGFQHWRIVQWLCIHCYRSREGT